MYFRGGAGKRILVGQALNTKLVPGGALLHKSTNIGMAVAIPAIRTAGALTDVFDQKREFANGTFCELSLVASSNALPSLIKMVVRI